MPQYVIKHAYRSARDGVALGPWAAGDTVELSEADAEWLERDSPGVVAVPYVAPVVEVPAVVDEIEQVERQQSPVRDRQARGGRNRGA